jgi:hypothetical protein
MYPLSIHVGKSCDLASHTATTVFNWHGFITSRPSVNEIHYFRTLKNLQTWPPDTFPSLLLSRTIILKIIPCVTSLKPFVDSPLYIAWGPKLVSVARKTLTLHTNLSFYLYIRYIFDFSHNKILSLLLSHCLLCLWSSEQTFPISWKALLISCPLMSSW